MATITWSRFNGMRLSMGNDKRCPECGAIWTEDTTCETHFHQMLYWEQEHQLPEVHHLMVLSYYLQHPHLYSPEGLKHSQALLVDFVVNGITPQQIRQRDRDKVDSGKRKFKIAGTPELHGSYEPPVRWSMTAADVVTA